MPDGYCTCSVRGKFDFNLQILSVIITKVLKLLFNDEEVNFSINMFFFSLGLNL